MSDRGNTPTEDDALGCYEEGVITSVDPNATGDGWYVTWDAGWTCGMPDKGVEPKVGDVIRTYGRIGRQFHGQALNGQVLWYKTQAEMDAEHRQWVDDLHARKRAEFEARKGDLDFDYAGLPPNFKLRIDRFRRANPDFRWEYEAYELFCCTEAVKIAERFGTVPAIDAWVSKPYAEQKADMPDLGDGHSGNTFGCAVGLAKLHLEHPERVALVHGAMAPLVGTADYSEVQP